MNPTRAPLLITALLAAGATGGCGSLAVGQGDFSCAGQPSHPLCLPTSAVYALTDAHDAPPAPLTAFPKEPGERPAAARRDPARPTSAPTALALFTGEASRAPRGARASREAHPDPAPPVEPPSEALLWPRSGEPLPLRLPAQVMRIWLAPWEDERGDLHATGYLYTEIVPRTWSLAEGPARPSTSVLRPLQVVARRPPESGRPPVRALSPAGPETPGRFPPDQPNPRSQP